MAINFERTAFTGNMDAFWRREVEMFPAGFKPLQAFPVGEVIRRGAFLQVDVDKMEAVVVKVGQVLDGGTTTAPRVSKRNNIVPGDALVKVGNTAAKATVKSVDRTNPEFDVITLAAAFTGLAKGDYLVEGKDVKAGETTTYEPAYTPNAVLGADLEIRNSGLPTIDAAYGAIVLKSVCPPFPASWLVDGGYCLKTNHSIKYINQ